MFSFPVSHSVVSTLKFQTAHFQIFGPHFWPLILHIFHIFWRGYWPKFADCFLAHHVAENQFLCGSAYRTRLMHAAPFTSTSNCFKAIRQMAAQTGVVVSSSTIRSFWQNLVVGFQRPLENRVRLPFFFSVCLSLFWSKKPLTNPTANWTSFLFQLFKSEPVYDMIMNEVLRFKAFYIKFKTFKALLYFQGRVATLLKWFVCFYMFVSHCVYCVLCVLWPYGMWTGPKQLASWGKIDTHCTVRMKEPKATFGCLI